MTDNPSSQIADCPLVCRNWQQRTEGTIVPDFRKPLELTERFVGGGFFADCQSCKPPEKVTQVWVDCP